MNPQNTRASLLRLFIYIDQLTFDLKTFGGRYDIALKVHVFCFVMFVINRLTSHNCGLDSRANSNGQLWT